MENIKRLNNFPSEDGHIESLLIGVDKVKVSFQTWDARQLVLIYEDVETINSSHAVYGDIGEYTITEIADGIKQFKFFSSWEEGKLVLCIEAKSVEIFEVGQEGGINSALFDVGYEYIGGQDINEQYGF